MRRGSWRYHLDLARAEFWVDNQGFPRAFARRRETTYVQTWHGTPMKRMGFDSPALERAGAGVRRQHKAMIKRWSALLVPSEYFVETFVKSYGYQGRLVRKGLPRNDLLVRGVDDSWAQAKKAELGLPTDRRLVLYCPTFRDRARRLETPYQLPLDLEQMRRALGDDVHLMLRPHYLDSFKLTDRYAPFATDVSRHHDVTELMLVADVLVTDYSSVMFDFANTGKPMVFYTYDYEDYVRDERGTYLDLPEVAPGPMVATTDELIKALESVDDDVERFRDKYAEFRERFCSFESGHAAEDVVHGVLRRPGQAMTVAEQPRDVFLVANNLEELGGVQRVTHNLALMLLERGHRVTVIGIQHAKEPHDYGDRPYRWLVLNEESEPPLPDESGLRDRLDPRVRAARKAHLAARKAAVDRLSALFAEAEDGLVVCMQVWSMNWVAPANTSHMHVIGMSHESFDATLGSTRWERVQQFYRDVDLLLLLTEHDAARFELEGFNNVGVMHNSLSFYPDVASDVSAKVVIAAGRLAPEKGYDRLINAFALVAGDHPDWLLKIFGTGPQRDRLQKQAKALGLADRVLLPGLADDIETELRQRLGLRPVVHPRGAADGARGGDGLRAGLRGLRLRPRRTGDRHRRRRRHRGAAPERRGPGRRPVPADGGRGAAAGLRAGRARERPAVRAGRGGRPVGRRVRDGRPLTVG